MEAPAHTHRGTLAGVRGGGKVSTAKTHPAFNGVAGIAGLPGVVMGFFLEGYGCRRLTWKAMARWQRKAWHRENDRRRSCGLPQLPKP